MQEREVAVNGEKLRAFEDGQGEPVLYLHGAGGANWYPLLEILAQTRHVIAPEHPGFGRSKIPEWMMSVGDLAYFYLDFLDTLGLENVHLVGHSLGGWTAAEIAVRNTTRLKSVSLLAPAGVRSPEVPFGDIFLWTPEEHARRSFYDRKLIEARIQQLPTWTSSYRTAQPRCGSPGTRACATRSFPIGCIASTGRCCSSGARKTRSAPSLAPNPI